MRARTPARPFLGLIDAVIVASPVEFSFEGAIELDHAEAAWVWMRRDVAPDLIGIDAAEEIDSDEALLALLPELLQRSKKALADASTSTDLLKRIKVQIGSADAWIRLPTVLSALRSRGLLEKAQQFGRAANAMADDASLTVALQTLPLQDPVTALLMQAMVGQVANPVRLVTGAIRIAGGASEEAFARSGFAPTIEAILAHAQDQLPVLAQSGPFADMDLVCRAVDRFHRLMRGITGYVELSRNGRWATIAGGLTRTISQQLDSKVRDVAPDLNRAMRRREGSDRFDADQILAALNGVYLLATIRDCRDSLALNTLFDPVWVQVGEALEIHIERHLEQLRRNPADGASSARFDAAIKMAELRFNQDYADTLRRAKDAIVRRA